VVPQRYPGRRDDQRGVCAVTEVRLCKDCRYAENTRGRWLCYHRTSIVVRRPREHANLWGLFRLR
jgi:hypothetical protein